jgi:amphi-Trp domain-containing protein
MNYMTTAHPAGLDAGCTVTGFKHEESVSRRQAAERLVDIAYALTAGETLELRAGSEQLSVRVADEVLLTRQGKMTGDHVSVELQLSWLT